MKSKILVIGDEALVTGFNLAGLSDSVSVNEQNFAKELESALAKPEFGIIIVNEKMLANIEWRLKKKLDSIAYPVIVPMPDSGGTSTEGDEIKKLIKRALGFDLAAKK
ncbi:V-type ATP synthase subunit F [Candidatus Micrarchaeota archaeon]|nr:V-type ATP synthase subunit F [Candidatus Micrarchaeota archaeon]